MLARKCLECRIGVGRVVLAADVVDVLGEYVVGARLPLSDRLEFSLGVWSEQAVLSISVTPHDPVLSRSTRGVLLLTGRAGLRWAFEVDAATGFVDVGHVAAGPVGTPWRCMATLLDRRTLPYIDVPLLMRELAVPPVARQAT
jgi:hypothetical protein